MTILIYRDIAFANIQEMIYGISSRLVGSGTWTNVAWSNGTSRVALAGPASASDLSVNNSWVVNQHTASGRKFGFQKTAVASGTFQYTDGIHALSAGSASVMDNNATYTKSLRSAAPIYPSSGTTTTKMQMVLDTATSSWWAFIRRSPFVGGSTDACAIFGMEQFTDVQWSANGDPCIASCTWDDANNVSAQLFSNAGVWLRFGIAGEAWAGNGVLENPGGVCGNTTVSPGGGDYLYALRWVCTSLPGPLGLSNLMQGLQPYRAPTTVVSASTYADRAAFGRIVLPNDGVPLAS